MAAVECSLSGMDIADGDEAVLVLLVDNHGTTPDESVIPSWLPLGYPMRGRYDGLTWVVPTQGDVYDEWTLRYVAERMTVHGKRAPQPSGPMDWAWLGKAVLDASATIRGHDTPSGPVTGGLTRMLARPDAFDALLQTWKVSGPDAYRLAQAVSQYVMADRGPMGDDSHRSVAENRIVTERRAILNGLGTGREVLAIADGPLPDGRIVRVTPTFHRAWEALALPCAMDAVGLAFAPGSPSPPLVLSLRHDPAVADRFRTALKAMSGTPDGPAPEPVDLDWRPADPEGPYTLFLDDLRFPAKMTPHVAIARSSAEAIAVATRLGMPAHMDYDHDLGGDDTAMRFVRWIVDQVIDHGAYVGDMTWAVHSSNPVGRDNIDGLMRNIVRHSREASATPGP